MNDIELQMLVRQLESTKVYVQDVWKKFCVSKGGRADDKELEYYHILKNGITESITRALNEINKH